MREIKFRGYNPDLKKWFYGSLNTQRSFADFIIYNDEACELMQRVKHETVGQFTGLKDKNGKDIYEGDLISDRRYDGNEEYDFLGEVVYKYDGFCLRQIAGSTKSEPGTILSFSAYDHEKDRSFKNEIIGNIHEHPHLLNP